MKFTVPFITETTELFEVEARSANEATMLATTMRIAGDSPTHSHVSKFKLGVVRTTIIEDVPADEA